MTYENCLKYSKEAKDEKTKLFWDERIKRKYPQVKKVVEEKPKKKKEVKKE